MRIPELDGISRPRWRSGVPALWRDSTTIQLGDDVVVDHVDAASLSWLRGLDGLCTSDEVDRRLPIDLATARRLLRALLAAGALDDAAITPTSSRWADRRHRDELNQSLDALVTLHHDSRVASSILDRRERMRVHVTGTGILRDEVAQALDTAGLCEVATVDKANLVVLADAHHPDVPAHFDRDAMDRPHVHVGAFGTRATIGPLVQPGVTSCLRCAHLHRRDADPAWPLLAVQWAQAVKAMGGPRVDPLLARAAALHAVVLVRAQADGPEALEPWIGSAIELRLPHLVGEVRPRPPHPLCGCLWQAAAPVGGIPAGPMTDYAVTDGAMT
jgi:hypothetical protein